MSFTLILIVLLCLGVGCRYLLHDRYFNGLRTSSKTTQQIRESRVSKIWGQLRLALVAILSFLAAQNIINATPEGIGDVLDGVTTLIGSVEGIITVVGLLLSSVGDWFAKEKAA